MKFCRTDKEVRERVIRVSGVQCLSKKKKEKVIFRATGKSAVCVQRVDSVAGFYIFSHKSSAPSHTHITRQHAMAHVLPISCCIPYSIHRMFANILLTHCARANCMCERRVYYIYIYSSSAFGSRE